MTQTLKPLIESGDYGEYSIELDTQSGEIIINIPLCAFLSTIITFYSNLQIKSKSDQHA